MSQPVFRERDVRKAIRSVAKEASELGLAVTGATVDRLGTISVTVGPPSRRSKPTAPTAPDGGSDSNNK